MNLTCTIIKLGRSDEFGRPFTLNQVYTGPYEYVRDLYTSGFATVADPTVFDGGAPYTPMTPVEVDALTDLAEDISVDADGNPTLRARIVPRHDVQSVLDSIAGSQYEIMYATDTKRFGVMSGNIAIPHTYLGLATGPYGSSLVAGTLTIDDTTGPVADNLVFSVGDVTLDGAFAPMANNVIFQSVATGSYSGSNSIGIGVNGFAGESSVNIGAVGASARSVAIGHGIASVNGSVFFTQSCDPFRTTNATPSVIPSSSVSQLVGNKLSDYEIVIIAKKVGAAGSACYRRRAFVENNAGTVSLRQTITLGTDYTAFAGFAPPAPAIAIDAFGNFEITVTGLAATNIDWYVSTTGVYIVT